MCVVYKIIAPLCFIVVSWPYLWFGHFITGIILQSYISAIPTFGNKMKNKDSACEFYLGFLENCQKLQIQASQYRINVYLFI